MNDEDEYSDFNNANGHGGLCDTERIYDVHLFLSTYLHSLIVILGLLGNLLIVVTYAFHKKTKSMTDIYLLNIALADIFFVVVLPFIIYNEQHDWAMGENACKLLQGAYSLNVYSGLLLLGCISCDRYLAIVCACRSRYLRSRTLVYSHIICFLVWLVALLLSLPSFIYSVRYQHSDEYFDLRNLNFSTSSIMPTPSPQGKFTGYITRTGFVNFTERKDNGKFVSSLPETSVTISATEDGSKPTIPWNDGITHSGRDEPFECILVFPDQDMLKVKIIVPSLQMAVGFLLPLVVMTFCYFQVILTLLKARNFQRHRAIRVVLTVVLVFIFCHLPYNLTLLVYTITLNDERECKDEVAIQVGLQVCRTMAYLHCCLNPFLYAFVGVRFRNHFQKVMLDLICIGKRYTLPRRQTSRITSEMVLSNHRSTDGSNGTSLTM